MRLWAPVLRRAHLGALTLMFAAAAGVAACSAAGQPAERARIYPIQFTGHGQPVPGGGAISFMSQLSEQDFSGSAARILPSGVIKES